MVASAENVAHVDQTLAETQKVLDYYIGSFKLGETIFDSTEAIIRFETTLYALNKVEGSGHLLPNLLTAAVIRLIKRDDVRTA